MLTRFRPLLRRAATSLETPRPRHSRRQRPGLDALEGRQLMTLDAVPFQVNLFSTNLQSTSAVATAPDGRSVVVWSERAPFNSNQSNIRGRLIGADGVPVGSDLVIANTPLDEGDPSVAINAQGNFVVTWTRQEAGGRSDIRAQRFTAAGAKVGGAILVSDLAPGSERSEDSDVALKPNGAFVVSYTRVTAAALNPLNTDLVVQRYNSAGTLLGTASNSSPFLAEEESSVAIRPNGGFVVASTRESLSSTGVPDVILEQYSSAGTKLATVVVANSPVEERDPDVGVDAFGNAVVAYQKFVNGTIEIKARRVTDGNSVGGEISISNDANFFDFDPEVAVNRNNGAFVVTYGRVTLDNTFRAEAVEVSRNNTILAHHDFANGDDDPHVGMDDQGNYLVTYTHQTSVGGDKNTFARRGRLPN